MLAIGKIFYVALPALVALTLLLTPLVVAVFRKKVAESMRQAATENHINPSIDMEVDISAKDQAVIPRIQPNTLLKLNKEQAGQLESGRLKLKRIAAAYAWGGMAQAVVMTFMGLLIYENARITNLIPLLLVFAIPIVPTVALVLSTRVWVRCLWVLGALVAAIILAGEQAGLIWDIFKLYILLPAIIFLIFNMRYWRAAAPLIMVLASGAAFGWMCIFSAGQQLVGNSSLIWLFRFAGLALGLWGAFKLVKKISQYYQFKKSSEQMLFIDIWWGLFTLMESSINMVKVGPVALFTLFAFVAYWRVSRMRLVGLQTEEPPTARLLLLRVFGHQYRVERLLDELTLRWRTMGTVELIAGRDLAFKKLGPSELYMFLTGVLSRAFIKDSAHLKQRLLSRDLRQDPDGCYRVSQYFCHRDTWQKTLDALVDESDAVLMDLRGFNEQRRGCQYEINKLAQRLGEKTIVLLTDSTTDVALAESILIASVPAERKHLLNTGANLYILEAHMSASQTVETAVQLLLGGQMATK